MTARGNTTRPVGNSNNLIPGTRAGRSQSLVAHGPAYGHRQRARGSRRAARGYFPLHCSLYCRASTRDSFLTAGSRESRLTAVRLAGSSQSRSSRCYPWTETLVKVRRKMRKAAGRAVLASTMLQSCRGIGSAAMTGGDGLIIKIAIERKVVYGGCLQASLLRSQCTPP